MLVRFTESARKVIQLAHEEARRSGFDSIETEHILLAFIKEDHKFRMLVLERLGITPESIQAELNKISSPSHRRATTGNLLSSSNVKTALSYASEESKRLGHDYLGTWHLLLGLLHDDAGVAARVLTNLVRIWVGLVMKCLPSFARQEGMQGKPDRDGKGKGIITE